MISAFEVLGQRPPRPGERCSCGKAAVGAFLTRGPDWPFCEGTTERTTAANGRKIVPPSA